MSPPTLSIPLERYRTEWSHLPLAFTPFLLAMSAMFLIMLLSRHIPESVVTVLGSLVGLGFAAAVFLFPRRWKRWRAQGRLELRIEGERAELFDPVTGRSLGRCRKVTPAEFHYTVTSRFAGGTYRAPAMKLHREDGSVTCVGIQGSSLTWPRPVEHIDRPDYVMDPEAWPPLVERLGIVKRLVTVVDARVH